MRRLLVGVVAILLLAMPLGTEPTGPDRTESDIPPNPLECLDQLYALLSRNDFYREAVLDPAFGLTVLAGIVRALGDEHACIVPVDSKPVQGESAFPCSDLGLVLVQDEFDRLVVASVIPGSPAARAGIRCGDGLLRVNGTNTSHLSPAEAAPLLVGPVDTMVSLVVAAGSAPARRVTLVRADHTHQTVTLRIGGLRFGRWRDDPEGRVAWLKVGTYLDPLTVEQWDRAVQVIQASPGVRDIILDLRDNGGGDNSCLSTLGDFFQSGELLVTFESAYGASPWRQEVCNYAVPRARLIGYPAVVLVNANTASLAEIATAALRDLRNVPVVGQTTFGKGTTQTWIRLDDAYALRLTAGRWFSPRGRSYAGCGICPDVAVVDDPRTARDEQLLRAVRTAQDR